MKHVATAVRVLGPMSSVISLAIMGNAVLRNIGYQEYIAHGFLSLLTKQLTFLETNKCLCLFDGLTITIKSMRSVSV